MVGTHILRTEVGINLMGSTAGIGYNDNFDFTAPLLDVGIWGRYAISNKFAINGNISYFSLKVVHISGKIINYNF